jgi:hypothetical protein
MTSIEGGGGSAVVSVEQLERELDELYRKGEEMRMENRRALVALRAKFNPLSKSLNDMGDSFSLSVYQDHLRQAFGDGNEPEPHVIKIQAQLCHALHCHEIQLKQTHITERRTKQLSKYFKKQVEELTLESRERERNLARRVEEERANLDALEAALESRARALDDEIEELRNKHGVVDIRMMSPETRVKSISESMYAMMEGIGFEELKNSDASAVLELTTTPTILSKSKLWIDLKAAGSVIGEGLGDVRRTSNLSKRSRHNGLGAASRQTSSRQLSGGSLHRSSHHRHRNGMDRSDHCNKPSRLGLMKSMAIGTSI